VRDRFVHRLPGQAEDQIAAHARHFLQRRLESAQRAVAIVQAAEELQLLGVERLHADRQTIDALLKQRARLVAVERRWVALDRDLDRIGFAGERAADRAQHAAQLGRIPERWRAAAEEHRAERLAGHVLAARLKLGDHRVGVRAMRDVGPLDRRGREVAVRALLQAPREVHVRRRRALVHRAAQRR
jgi:hypothetical protein